MLDAFAAHIAKLGLVIQRCRAQRRVRNDGDKAVARSVFGRHGKTVPAQLSDARAGCGVDMRHIGRKGGGHIPERTVSPNVGGGDGYGLIAKAIKLASHSEGDVVKLQIHNVLDRVRADDLGMLLSAQLNGFVQMVDGAYHNVGRGG